MTLRRLTFAVLMVCGLCVWGFAHSGDALDPAEGTSGGTRSEAEARFRANQSTHWRHVAVGNYSCSR